MKEITILGSTGSIGVQALDVARRLNYKVFALSSNRNVELLLAQAREFTPKIVCLGSKEAADEFMAKYSFNTKVVYSKEGLCEAASHKVDVLLNAISGFYGLYPTIAAIEAGSDLALANKESLVAAGDIIKELAKEKGVCIRPVDSEHSAIWQCLQGENRSFVSKVILTASGGPFRGRKDLANITPKEALAHPNWSMGDKISCDSATMMNKALEVVEAARLFDLSPEEIDVIVHRESIVHSFVEFKDSSCKAQLSMPDMRIPIQLALSYPERMDYYKKPLDLAKIASLTFEEPDYEVFPQVRYGHIALEMAGVVPCVMSAANESAVDMFFKERISFLDISKLVKVAMDRCPHVINPSIDDIIEADRWAREFVLNGGC